MAGVCEIRIDLFLSWIQGEIRIYLRIILNSTNIKFLRINHHHHQPVSVASNLSPNIQVLHDWDDDYDDGLKNADELLLQFVYFLKEIINCFLIWPCEDNIYGQAIVTDFRFSIGEVGFFWKFMVLVTHHHYQYLFH